MSDEPPVSIAVVCEAPADLRTAAGITDRVTCDEIDWITPDVVDSYRRYRGIEMSEPFAKWSRMRAEASKRNVRAHGHFRGEPGDHDAQAARKVLMMMKGASCPPRAVLLIRDTDNDERRITGMNQARNDGSWGFAVIIGIAHPKRECWVLAGFEPKSPAETKRLRVLREELGFDPRTGAAGLTSKSRGTRLDAKRVLDVLLSGDVDREEDCWTQPELELLEARGKFTGLSGFLCELRERLSPLLR